MSNFIIDSLNIPGTSDVASLTTPYGTCSTAAATAAKVVTCPNFVALEAGAKITVKFSNVNSIANPTLDVNSTGAKTITCHGVALTGQNINFWRANEVITFTYDGSTWCVDGMRCPEDFADILAINDAMLYKGTIAGNTTAGIVSMLPTTANAGWTYKVSTAGYIGSRYCQVGDMVVCNADTTSGQDTISSTDKTLKFWDILQTNVDITAAITDTDAKVPTAGAVVDYAATKKHNHSVSDVDGLQDALDAKAPVHDHSYVPTSEKGVANGVATLDENSKVPVSQLPSTIKTAEPKEDLDAANKKYVDAMVEDLHKKILGAPTEGLEYELSDDGTYYTCIGIGTATDTDIVIASEIDGKPVTSIGYGAFSNCSSLTSVVIGDSVTSISTEAFYFCSNLTSVLIPNSVESIGYMAFYGCESLTSIEIPDSVTNIGEEAFYGCSSLTNVLIGDSVTSIGDGAFWYCSSLTSVVIPDSVTSISDSVFSECSSLTSIVIPDSVTSIGGWAFAGCSNLTIYCKYKENEIPEGWNAGWNYSNCPVVWGFANDFVEVDKKLTENYAPRMTKFDESWGHNRIYYIKNAQLTEEGEIPTTAELSVEVPAGKSIMVCAVQDDNNESDYSYIDANGLPIEPPIEYGWEGALATPVVTINDGVASWAAIEGATHYMYLIGTPTAYNSTSNSFANTYNRVYVERTKNRGVYSRYALSSANAPVDPDPADFARNICLDSIPMRMSNGYIMAPPIFATDTAALDKIAERGYSLDYYLMPKRYTDSYTSKYFSDNVPAYITTNVPVMNGQGQYSVVLRGDPKTANTTKNKVTGKYAVALGEGHTVSSNRGFAGGYVNTVTGTTGTAFGQEVSVSSWLGFGAGYKLSVEHDKQTVFGYFNKARARENDLTNGYKLIFSVGNGTATARNNAFEIYEDGRASVGKAPIYAMNIVNKGYVDNQVSQINTKITTLETKINNSSMDDSIFDIVLNLQTGAN